MTRFRSLVLCSLMLVLAACASTSENKSNHITLLSSDFGFISDIYEGAGKQREVNSWLVLPESEQFSPPYPAVVFLHSSWGLSDQEWHYSRLFAEMGIASLVIDSFRSRGVRRTSRDQSLVSGASMLADAFSALDYLAKDSRIQSQSIAVMGFSKGAVASLYSSLVTVQSIMARSHYQFAAHIAFYPWCGTSLTDMQTSGVPIAIHAGTKDVITPLNRCIDLVENKIADDDKSHIQLVQYEGARHAFDHPALKRIPFAVPLSAQVPGDCHFVQKDNSKFIEESSGQIVSGENFKEVMAQCSSKTGVAGRDRKAAALANENVKNFMRKVLLN